MKHILVIGGTGFIGSHLVEKLYDDGYKVAVLVRKNSDTRFIKTLKGIELRTGDLLEADSLRKAFLDVDTVFCLVNVRPEGKSQERYEEELKLLHIDGIINIINACKANGVKRLIYFSSVAAIGYKKGIKVYNESSEANPIDVYGKVKLEAETILHRSSNNRELDVTILRPSGAFGERGLGVLKKILFFIEKGFIPIIGQGKNYQSITYVGNIIDQAVFLANNPSSIGNTYITTDGRPYSVNELIDTVAKVIKRCPLKIHIPVWLIIFFISFLNFSGRIFLRREIINKENFIAIGSERIFDGSKIFRELGYIQGYDLLAGVTRTVGWYKKEKTLNKHKSLLFSFNLPLKIKKKHLK